jgi:hypothetical protein
MVAGVFRPLRGLKAVQAGACDKGGVMPGEAPAGTPAPASKAVVRGIDIAREVADALFLLDYAVANGVKTADGNLLPENIIVAIKTAAEKLGAAGTDKAGLAAAEWAAFETAYYDLSIALAPVTAETLRNTQTKPFIERTGWERIAGDCPAIRFTRALWALTFVFAAFVLGSAWYMNVMAVIGDTDTWLKSRTFFEVLTPWMYGGLGACVYLLRSAHIFIHRRCFDVHRKPEYYNRILLGAVAGGAILLFVSEVTDDDGQVIKLSSAALGFLAGYNTDFLFNAIERVSAALLPKIGVESVQREKPVMQPANLNDLADRLEKAQGADKELYRALMARLAGIRTPPAAAAEK